MLPELSADVAPWLYYSVGALATLIVGIGKAGFGGGVGIVAVPILAVVLPTNLVLGVLLPLLIAGDVFSLPHYWGKQSNIHTRWLCVGATFGFMCGAALLTFLQRSGDFVPILNLGVGGICLCFVLLQAYRLTGGNVPSFPGHPAAGRTAGFLAAFAATLAHAAGPLVSLYLLEQRLEKQQIVATNLIVFFFVNMAKLAIYAVLGLVTTATLMQSLSFVPFIPLGTVLGAWLHTRIPERPFVGVLYTSAAVAAARLIYKTLV